MTPPEEAATQRRFDSLATQWRDATGHLSSLTKKLSHAAYREIVSMGRDAIGPLLRELEKPDPGHWGPALREITGQTPFEPSDAGRNDRIAAAWIKWARDAGVRW